MSIVPPRWLPAALAAAALTATTARCALADPPAANPAAEGRSFLLRPARVWSAGEPVHEGWVVLTRGGRDRKSTRLNSSHLVISYAVFCLKKKRSTQPDFMHIGSARRSR